MGIYEIHLAASQSVIDAEQSVRHVHQDLVLTIRLKSEVDKRVRPEEKSAEVARLTRDSDGPPARSEVRPQHLQDDSCARGMGLVVISFRRRSGVTEDSPRILLGEGPH